MSRVEPVMLAVYTCICAVWAEESYAALSRVEVAQLVVTASCIVGKRREEFVVEMFSNFAVQFVRLN